MPDKAPDVVSHPSSDRVPGDNTSQHSWSGEEDASVGDASGSEEGDGMSVDNNNNESIASYPINSSKYIESVQKFKKLFSKLFIVYPSRFRIKDSVTPYYASMSQSGGGEVQVPHLKLQPVLKGSWLDPPDRYHLEDSNRIWNNIHNIVPKATRHTPQNFALAAGPACPYYSVGDPDLKRFLNAKQYKKIDLDHTLFDKSSVDVGTSPHSPIDAILRKALCDTLVNDELFKVMFELAGSFLPRLQSTIHAPNLELLFSTLGICAENNQRSGQSILAALVCNKVALRDVVLRRFSVPDTSKAILRGSDFKSDKLFGPLPESFRETLLHPMGNIYKCTSRNKAAAIASSRHSFSKSSFPKKRSSTSGFSDAKRFKSSASGASSVASKNFRNKFRKKK